MKFLEDALKQKDWSIREMAKACGLPNSSLSEILSGKKKVTLDIYIKLSEGLDEPIEKLLVLGGVIPDRSDYEDIPSLSLRQFVELGKRLTYEQRLEVLNFADYLVNKEQQKKREEPD